MPNPFSVAGQWFKGNLHLHTTGSDGKLTPQEAITSYAAHGYDFLSITDHRQVTATEGLDHKGMLMLPGIEMDGGRTDLGSSYHMVAMGAKRPMSYDSQWSAQELIDYGNENAEFVFIAHPYWCSLTLADLIDLEGYIGLEVYNTTCHYGVGRGDSGVHWDDLLARGRRLYGFGVDDAHFGYGDGWVGYTMVKAERCEYDHLIAAMKAGHFYASNGPTINNLQRDGTKVLVEFGPDGLTFATSSTLTLDVQAVDWDGVSKILIWWLNPATNKWELEGVGQLSRDRTTVTFNVDHFSMYGIGKKLY